jgi:hypothetical protein
MTHQEIALHLRRTHRVGDWWSQMVTVGYEQGSGRRQKHQMADGYRIGASKTVDLPVKSLYRAWADPVARERWLPGADLLVRTSTENKSMRITWDASTPKPTSLLIAFYSKGPAKSQVTVEHGKLPSPGAGEKLKRFWTQRLAALSTLLKG